MNVIGSMETTIPCDRGTRDRVKALKRGGERYDDVLNRLVDQTQD